VMSIECLQPQIPSTGGGTKQLLPLAGTQKTATVGADLKASISYTRSEANLVAASDYVTVAFNGATDGGLCRVTMVPATTVSKPKVGTKEIDIARTSETAYFNVTVIPKQAAYSGNLVVQRKNGINSSWVNVAGSPFSGAQPFLVPISGNDFAVGKDTMYYTFTASSGTYTDPVSVKIIVRDPYFYLKRSATLTLGGTSAGVNLLTNAAVAENDATAMIGVAGTLALKGGSAWLAAGNTIQFVASTAAMYTANKSSDAIAAYNAGIPASTVDAVAGDGVYIFRAVTGPNPADVYYGMLKTTSILPGISVTFEYRIGDQYAHLLVIQ